MDSSSTLSAEKAASSALGVTTLALQNQFPHNLPLPVNRFIGREKAIAEVRARLLGEGQPAARLLTLTGAGGAGKTRLALQVAAAVRDHFPDGVWLIDLAPVTDPALATDVIADTLGVHGEVNRPLLATLFDWLRTKHLLLLLDNCEHLLDACAHFAVGALQAGAVSILATSREALNIAGEALYPVVPLTLPASAPPTAPFPSPSGLPSTASQAQAGDALLAALHQSEAARLFIDRACLVQPTFQVTTANAPALAQLCQQLDGIPLAIELAAARVKALPVEKIAERMGDRFRLLAHGPRNALPRHQALRALVDWSYELLTAGERVLLRRLALFAGGWTLEAAEAICCDELDDSPSAGSSPDDLVQADILPLLTRLVEKSLVTWDGHQGKMRYRLLETIRQYAQEKLQEAHEEAWLGRRHFTYFLQMARESESLITHGQRLPCIARLLADHDNLRAAILWACRNDGEAACQLVGLLRWFWYYIDLVVEGEEWHQRVLALPTAAPHTPSRTLALLSHAALKVYSGRVNLPLLQELVVTFQTLNAPVYLCETVWWLGAVLTYLGKTEEARRLFAQHAPLLRQVATPLVRGNALVQWATAQPDFAQAQPLFEEALALGYEWQEPGILAQTYLQMGDCAQKAQAYERARLYHIEGVAYMRQIETKWLTTRTLMHVGVMSGFRGNWSEARAYFVEGLQLAHAAGFEQYVATASAYLGYIAVQQGNFNQAESYFAEALAICRARQLYFGQTLCLINYANLRLRQGHPTLAVRLLAVDNVRKTFFSFDVYIREETLAAARNQLTEAEFNAAQADGQTLTLETALAYASTPVTTNGATPALPQGKQRQPTTKQRPANGLSQRETEVVRLLAQGLSNRAIADQLILSERTVERHVANILAKQNFTSRTQIAAWALTKGFAGQTES
ncbi:MAG: LuxR C-terminal-related transcriptional regulator [Caldilineaceae bacterium]